METIADYFGEYVFNDAVMQKRLPKETYRQLKETISKGKDLDLSIANVVASVMQSVTVSSISILDQMIF